MRETTTTRKPLTPAETERFSWIMGASGTQWGWWIDVEYHGGDWDSPSDITFTIEDPDDGYNKVIVKRVTARNIVRALGTARRTVPSMRSIEPDDLDASSADCVLQIAVLGEVVYG